MSNRERWIVYPLLLFAVGSTIVDRLIERGYSEFQTLQCEELIVASPQGIPRIVLSQSLDDASGLVSIHGPSAGPNSLESYNDVQAEIGANEFGGFVRIKGDEGGTVTLVRASATTAFLGARCQGRA